MGLLRKSALQEIGGWDEWCITEGAEASLRILRLGYESQFINKTYGQGVIPFTFEGLKKQRFRWCFGGVQILKKHWRSLLPGASWVNSDNRLTPQQRYFYGAVCASAAVAVLAFRPDWRALFLAGLLSWQAGLYLAAPAYSSISVYGRIPAPLSSRADIRGREVRENWAARWAVALLLLLTTYHTVWYSFRQWQRIIGDDPKETRGLAASRYRRTIASGRAARFDH
jgi:hypothetical protein